MDEIDKLIQEPIVLNGCCIPRNAADLLHAFPRWHKMHFDTWDNLDIGSDGYPMWGYILNALNNISDEMSITDICLLIFPLPKLEKYRKDFAIALLAESSFKELPLSKKIKDWDISSSWNCQKDVFIKLKDLEKHLNANDLLMDSVDYGWYVHIWRRHLEERKMNIPFGESLEDHIRSAQITEDQKKAYPKLTNNMPNLKAQILYEIKRQELDPSNIDKAEFIREFHMEYRMLGVTTGMLEEAWKQLRKEKKLAGIRKNIKIR